MSTRDLKRNGPRLARCGPGSSKAADRDVRPISVPVSIIVPAAMSACVSLFSRMRIRRRRICSKWSSATTSAANAKELYFDKLDSGYRVGTAGTNGVGRSSTLQLFHGSEVAFWPYAETHASGILQAISDAPGSESILESTANGIGNFFHRTWRDAEMGRSDFIAIFVPWYWQEEYRKEPPPDFLLDEE